MRREGEIRQRFTVIELLVLITIVVVLAACAGPALQSTQLKSKQNQAMQQAIGIAKALRIWSEDKDGAFPEGENANLAFAQLFPEFGNEIVFFVRGSAWHGSTSSSRFAKGPDSEWGQDWSGGAGKALEPGENHWAFNRLATAESAARLPLIADGFSSQIGVYSSDKRARGGVWGGKTAIVVFADTSAKIVKLNSQFKYTNPKANDRDEFRQAGVDMVNPAPPVD